MGERSERIRDALRELRSGNREAVDALFAPDAQWLGVPGSGIDGATPI